MEAINVINIVALILAPIIAVAVGQQLQNRAKKREDKMNIFKALMTARLYGWTYESVHALNIIDIVFADSPTVRDQWAVYRKCLAAPEGAFNSNEAQKEQWKLIETISNDLGYKGKITWETIQNPYRPIGLSKRMEEQAQFEKGQLVLADLAQAFAPIVQSRPFADFIQFLKQIMPTPQSPENRGNSNNEPPKA